MNEVFVLVAMIFFHIVDDYYLQGWLASAKQKKWWEENAPQELYKSDYIMALIMHSISWSFMILLPFAIFYGFNCGIIYITLLFCNALIHGVVDDLKANKFKINLIVDQQIHLLQIFITFFIVLSAGRI